PPSFPAEMTSQLRGEGLAPRCRASLETYHLRLLHQSINSIDNAFRIDHCAARPVLNRTSRRMNIAVKPFDLAATSLRDAMRRVAGGVSVVTVGAGDDRTGLTVTSAVSLSIDVPTMLVSVNRTASAWPVLQKHRSFCVNFLNAGQQAVADRFAGKGG